MFELLLLSPVDRLLLLALLGQRFFVSAWFCQSVRFLTCQPQKKRQTLGHMWTVSVLIKLKMVRCLRSSWDSSAHRYQRPQDPPREPASRAAPAPGFHRWGWRRQRFLETMVWLKTMNTRRVCRQTDWAVNTGANKVRRLDQQHLKVISSSNSSQVSGISQYLVGRGRHSLGVWWSIRSRLLLLDLDPGDWSRVQGI